MITIAANDFVYQRDVPADCIGVLSAAAEVTIFLPGDETSQEWQALHPPPDHIAEAKTAKRAQITTERDAACVAPVQALGHTWQADEGSQALLNKAVTLAVAALPLPEVWRDIDNVDMPITNISQLLAIGGAMAAATQAAYTAAFARKDALAAAETLEEIAEI